MPENEIIAEIHRHREELARRFDFDVRKISDYYRSLEAADKAAGRIVVAFNPAQARNESAVVREDSPPG